MKIRNKDVIQSYLVTSAKYDYNVDEKRVLYRLVEMAQKDLEGKKLDANYSIDKTLFDDRVVTMPVSGFLPDGGSKNHERVKTALKNLRNKTFEYEDDKAWELIGIIEKPKFLKEGYVRFEVQSKIYDAILNFSKGFRKIELATAMNFDSVYTMRFYELLSGQKKIIDYSIEKLKIMFGIEEKYTNRPADFINFVVKIAKKELDKKSPYSFKFKVLKTGRKITAIRFYPLYIPKNRDPKLEKLELKKQVSPAWEVEKILIDYLKQNFLFTTKEIQRNIEVIKQARQELDIMNLLSTLKGTSRTADNPKGFVIWTLKDELEKAKLN